MGSEVESSLQPLQIEGAECFHEGFPERAANAHGFPDALHGGGKNRFGPRKLLKSEAWNLGDHVIECGFERGGGFPGDVVLQFVQGVAHREFGGDFGNGKSGGLGSQGGGAGDAGIHLNDNHATGPGANGELDVRSPGLHADFPNHGKGSVAHALIFPIGQGLGGRNRDAVPRVDPHGVKVLDRTNNDAVVRVIAHDLHFILLPTEKGFFDQNFRSRGGVEPGGGKLFKFLPVVGNTAPGTAQGESGSDDERKGADFFGSGPGLVQGVGSGGAGTFQPDLGHAVFEELAILSLADGLHLGADQFDLVPLERPRVVQGHGSVEGGLAPQGGEQGIRFFLGEDEFDDLGGDGLDVGPVRKLRIGHDGGGIAVDQDDAVALLAQGLAGLDTRVIKLTGLPDDDGPGSDDEDGPDVVSPWHWRSE